MKRPNRIANGIATYMGTPAMRSEATMMPESPKDDPAERSVPPQTKQKVNPQPMIRYVTICCDMFIRLFLARNKFGFNMEKIMNMIIKAEPESSAFLELVPSCLYHVINMFDRRA